MKIGFVDFYISEWHANNYPTWIKEVCGDSDDMSVKYAWAEEYVSPVDNKNTDEWCVENGIERCMTLEELCEKSDFIVVLAPSNPEKHLEYAKTVLKYKKNTYIDKTFAPNLNQAEEIFAIARQHGTKFFSTSALRYATELEGHTGTENLITTGGGSNMPEYLIHQTEMAVRLLKSEPTAVRTEAQGTQRIFTVKYENGGWWTGIWSPTMRFTVCSDKAYTPISSDFFKLLIADMVSFFKTGSVSFNADETLKVMKLREAILSSCDRLGEWVSL